MQVHGFVGFRISKRLQALKRNIKEWNINVFGKIDVSRDALSQKVKDWDRLEEDRGLFLDERSNRWEAIKKMGELNHMDEVSWRQKSRVFWLKEGEKTTNFFHCMANVKRRVNFIGKIKKGPYVIDKLKEVNEEIATFFENLFQQEKFPRPNLDGV